MGKTLKNAQININDNYFTRYEDIASELSHYSSYFTNKSILCNFDDPLYSNFYRYFVDRFSIDKPKKVVFTHINSNGPSQATIMTERGVSRELLPDGGDYRSESVMIYFKEADVIVTNPPFSQLKNLMELIIENKKDYILIANKNAITQKLLFNEFMSGRLFLGHNDVKYFYEDNGYNAPSDRLKMFGNIGWISNIYTNRHPKTLYLTKSYSKDKYRIFDNFDAICVDRIKDIPKDYDGVMAVPLSFINYYDENQWEIVGMDINPIAEQIGIKTIGKQWIEQYRKNGGTAHYSSNMRCLTYVDPITKEPVVKYKRLLIKRKK